jgi:hypothetical protein
MVAPDQPDAPAVGACLRCNNMFLVTSSGSTCMLCGRPPDLALPFGQFVSVGEEAELVPSAPGRGALSVAEAWIECPNCQALLSIRTSGEVLQTITPPAVPPAEEAGPGSSPPPEPASPPAEPEPAPAMAQDIFGNPIEGPPPPPAPIESATEASPGSAGEGPAAAPASTAPEETPA